ncbi:SET domain-containing protein 5 [Venturia nashicola]|uniref:SET domain-containing protein 5 n=1 Tax=Venturia nashicola TaxID=86259 RepID=A0A4Z1PEK3_9PEZI|nr:SET domain-containing protein 5 [Venturia nashicola]TLD30275.1 SET domain-containing protein 5 [Venturia nashicola]
MHPKPSPLILLSLLPLALAVNIVDFSTCNIPYIIPLDFQQACDRSDEYLSEDLPITHLDGNHETILTAPTNITASFIRSRPNIWTHEPFCIESREANNGFCVYTNDRFANGRGISIVATPKEIMNIVSTSILKEPFTAEFENQEIGAKKYKYEQIPGKGLGVIANATFARGAKLQSYTPILAFQDDMMQFMSREDQDLMQSIAVSRLPMASQNIFYSLMGHAGENPILDRINTNAFTVNMGSFQTADFFWGVLPETSRFNHDCRPNSAYFFNSETLSHHVHAVRKIRPGEEITISYLTPYLQTHQREHKMSTQWGFKCSCSLCTAPKQMQEISDHRLSLIPSLETELNDLSPTRTATPSTALLLATLFESESLIAAAADAYMYASLEYAYISDKRNAQIWAAKAVEGMALSMGKEHVYYVAMWDMLTDPEKTDAWGFVGNGFRMRNGTVVPEGVEPKVAVSGGAVMTINGVSFGSF